MGSDGVFMGSDYWRWNFWTFHKFLLGRCLPATYCTEYYGFSKKMKEEQGLLIQQKKIWMQQGLNPWMKEEQGLLIQQKKIWMQQGLNPWPKGERPALKPRELKHTEDIILPFDWTCNRWLFLLKLHHSRRTKRTFAKWACLIYEPGANKLLFILQQLPQIGAFSITGCNMWSANP